MIWFVLLFFLSSWKQDIHHRTMSLQWGKAVPYLQILPVIWAQASPRRMLPSLRLLPQQGISEHSWPALTPLKSPHTLRIVLPWLHHPLWGEGTMVTAASWQQSSPWAWTANPTEGQPSSPLSRAPRGKHREPPQGRSLLQRSVGALLHFILINSWASWWWLITHWCQSLGTGDRFPCGCLCLGPSSWGDLMAPGAQSNKLLLMMNLLLEGRSW